MRSLYGAVIRFLLSTRTRNRGRPVRRGHEKACELVPSGRPDGLKVRALRKQAKHLEKFGPARQDSRPPPWNDGARGTKPPLSSCFLVRSQAVVALPCNGEMSPRE